MSAVRQVRYLFTSTDNGEIDLTGFVVRDKVVSLAPARYSAAFKAASILDNIPPPFVEGAETDEFELIAYAKRYNFNLTKTDSDNNLSTIAGLINGLVVEGAGTSAANGFYKYVGDSQNLDAPPNTYGRFEKDGYVVECGDGDPGVRIWVLTLSPPDPYSGYYTEISSANPWDSAYIAYGDTEPAPTIRQATVEDLV